MKIPKKTTNAKKRPEKSQTLFPVLPFLCHKKHLNYMNIKKFSFEIKIKSCLPLYCNTDLPWLFIVCQTARFGQNGTYCFSRSFLHERLSFTPVLAIKIKRAFPFRCNYRFSSAMMQTCLQSAETVLRLQHNRQCTHFQWLRKNLISNLASLKYHWYRNTGVCWVFTKGLQTCCGKNRTATFYFIRIHSSVKTAKKEPNRQTHASRPANLRCGQKMPKGQLEL